MQDTILKVNMLYFISAIVKKTKGMGFYISFEKKQVFFFFQNKFPTTFYLSLIFMPDIKSIIKRYQKYNRN